MQEISSTIKTVLGLVEFDLTTKMRVTVARKTGHHIDVDRRINGYAWRTQTGPRMGIILSTEPQSHNHSIEATAAHEAVHLVQFIREEGKAVSNESEALFVEQVVGNIQQGLISPTQEVK
jgi:hypothetical protein